MGEDSFTSLLAGEGMRTDLPLLRTTDDLSHVLAEFSRGQVAELPVALPIPSRQIARTISGASVMRRLHRETATQTRRHLYTN